MPRFCGWDRGRQSEGVRRGKRKKQPCIPCLFPWCRQAWPQGMGWGGPWWPGLGWDRQCRGKENRLKKASWDSVQARGSALLGFLSHPFPASPFRPWPSSDPPWTVALVFLRISQVHSFSSDLFYVTSLEISWNVTFLMSHFCSKTLLPPFLTYFACLDLQGNKPVILHSTPSM